MTQLTVCSEVLQAEFYINTALHYCIAAIQVSTQLSHTITWNIVGISSGFARITSACVTERTWNNLLKRVKR